MKKFFLIYIGLCVSSCLYAQKDERARQILDNTELAIREAKGIHAIFSGTNQGTLLLSGDKFYLDCAGIISWFDGKTQWSYVSDTEEVTISNPTKEELQGVNPYVLIQSFKEGYHYQYKGKSTHNGKTGYKVILIPEQEHTIKTITLFVSGNYLPYYIKIEQTNGTVNEIQVISCKTNQIFNEKVFMFDEKKFPDAEIIDLR